jgi:hypothetical protein
MLKCVTCACAPPATSVVGSASNCVVLPGLDQYTTGDETPDGTGMVTATGVENAAPSGLNWKIGPPPATVCDVCCTLTLVDADSAPAGKLTVGPPLSETLPPAAPIDVVVESDFFP